jgi:hypothetical protein
MTKITTPYHRQALMLSFVLSLSLFSISCGNSQSTSIPATDCGSGAVPPSRSIFAIQDSPATQIATQIAKDVGKLVASGQGDTNRTIFIFEERHDSRLAQMEIALMLWRLQKNQGLRQVSLEGAFASKGDLPATFHSSTNAASNRTHQEVALTLLREGEISAAEFIALAAPAVHVRGNEIQSEYKVEASKTNAALAYLMAIAERSLTSTDAQHVDELIGAKKIDEALNIIFSKDPWCKERYDQLYGDKHTASTEESEVILREIEQKTKALGLEIDPQDQAGFRADQGFYQMASKRSCTMFKNTLAMIDPTSTTQVALIIGAAHTPKVVELIKAAKLNYVVLAPASMGRPHKATDLTATLYQRKLARKSIDEAGMLGALLDGRKKPPPVLGEKWSESKIGIYTAVELIVNAATQNEPIPSDELKRVLGAFKSIKIDWTSFKKKIEEGRIHVIFKVTAQTSDTNPDKTLDIWADGWHQPPLGPPGKPPSSMSPSDDDFDMEKLILAAREEERNKADQTPTTPPKVAVVQLTTKTKAAFSTDPSLLQGVTVTR